jgi:hypothetical protein
MLAYAVTGASGWLMMVLLLAIILYPFLLRAGMLGPIQPFFKRLRLHYWMAYTFAGVLLLHLWVAMSGALALGASVLGLDLATIALFLLIMQIALGWQLRAPARSRRRVLRRRHFWLMLALVACVLAHVALNSGTLQMLFAA